jgi:ubiquitin carboxyl-terminal hydrolase 8
MLGVLNLLNESLTFNVNYIEDEKIHKHLLDSKKVFHNHFKDNWSIITDMFFGQYIQKVKCLECGKKNYTYQPFIGINLAIPVQKILVNTLPDLLSEYFKKQEVNKVCEDSCKKKTKHSLKTRIIKLPKYLIIHFKRFDNNLRKLETSIAFNSELELSDHMVLLENSSVEYNLMSVINHYGSNISSGHYSNFNRTFDGKWYNIDDDTTEEIESISVCTKNAYMLIYELDEF